MLSFLSQRESSSASVARSTWRLTLDAAPCKYKMDALRLSKRRIWPAKQLLKN